jgi:hypothetical protein
MWLGVPAETFVQPRKHVVTEPEPDEPGGGAA